MNYTNRILTCTDGFEFEFTKNITKSDYILMCKIISNKFNDLYQTISDYKIIPECISEGGFLFVDFTNKTRVMYKSLRIHIDNQNFSYPGVNIETVMNSWLSDDTILINFNMKGRTFIKAFYDAPKWTIEELDIFRNVFQSFGAICKKFPKKI